MELLLDKEPVKRVRKVITKFDSNLRVIVSRKYGSWYSNDRN